jgi:hypothetical protein
VHSRVTRVSLLSAAIGVVAILAAGCAASGNSASGGSSSGAKTGTTAPVSPQQALLLASNSSQAVNTISATVSVQATASGSAVDIAGTVTERLHPSLLADVDFTTFSAAGQSVPGGLAEILTPSAVYMKFSELTQALNISKSWVEIPLTSLGANGSTLSSLLSDAQEDSPVTQTELLAHSKTVHKVGTGVLDGVPVTEYAGTYSLSQAIAMLPANVRPTLSKDMATTGISTAQFEIWLDGQNHPRKIVVTESGTSINETVTENITSFNQPVSVQVPTAAETYVLPASALSGLNNS